MFFKIVLVLSLFSCSGFALEQDPFCQHCGCPGIPMCRTIEADNLDMDIGPQAEGCTYHPMIGTTCCHYNSRGQLICEYSFAPENENHSNDDSRSTGCWFQQSTGFFKCCEYTARERLRCWYE